MNFNWMKYKIVYAIMSAVFVGVGVLSLAMWGLPLGLEFTGGAEIDYKVSLDKRSDVMSSLEEIAENAIVQSSANDHIIVKLPEVAQEERGQLLEKVVSVDSSAKEVQFQQVGPSIGPELIKKTFFAIAIVAGSIFLWVAVQFRRIPFGVAAIFAMVHDTMVLIGVFSLLGHFYNAQVDFLFVTAVLTTLSFSVHDTIVVFDRIRELSKKHGGSLEELANRAVSETMRRSIINSMTIIVVLLSLVVWGGESIRWFATALLVGAISGTYSSPFIAVPLYITLEKLFRRSE
ncbi:protein-export membrane protein SecF [Candidatus Woesebacteria bacterium RIFCSPHIGHO2_01_FULL_41_10]|uniref:Protein-export membrane protein SecF n=1 Tax=Candidatus Woesebacteria bacterium RIFCSPHIGHO2_01_FULL_41_10 TaxID=1802500 RepID=A0A1F7YPA1_9BACT|nr:MAG: protein-export membrane protein SecF [Candidatus Woesebacteria bacterium RIFCSPHIGHO2_01_FULL_41_10]